MADAEWAAYDQWNTALTKHLFSSESAGMPVYIDVDEAFLDSVATDIAEASEGRPPPLSEVVLTTLDLEGAVFSEHTRRFQAWRREFSLANSARRKGQSIDIPAPPVIALLTVLVLAAEKMGGADGMAPTAYYPRLSALLGLDERKSMKLRSKFPQTEPYWRGLNEYLEAYEGQRGLPTAYALAWRYVGIPQSQAVVRASDRRRLPDFFIQFGLVPGSEMIPADLERLLDLWIGARPSPVTANLQALWKGVKARERVAGVVAVELSLWDGTGAKAHEAGSRVGAVQLTALSRKGFGSRSLELSFAARMPEATQTSELEIASAEEAPRIGVVPAAGARLRPIPGSRLDPASLVGALVDLRDPVSGQTISRRPRRVVPLRQDELMGVLVETERIQLADDAVLLVKDNDALLVRVLDLVGKYGHHGVIYRATPKGDGDEKLIGLPEGWVLIEDVQIYAIPQDVKLLDLNVLVPLTTAQLNFSGGLKMPGRIRKWSRFHPPEIRAAVDQAESMAITLTSLNGDDDLLLERWQSDACAMVVPLVDTELEDGDYEVALYVNGERHPISQTTLRLRSGDTPDAVTWETCTRLNYELGQSAFGALSAAAAEPGSTLVVDGLLTVGASSTRPELVPIRAGASWAAKKISSGVVRPVVVLGTADEKSCVVTGAHYIVLPDWHGGRAKHSQIQGTCKHCGLQKTLPARPRWKKNDSAPIERKEIRFSDLPSHTESSVELDSCLDATVHVGGGPIGALERIASQAQGGALFFDQYLRALEILGHIDVRRDDRLEPLEWEANPAYVAETCSGRFVLAGVWSSAARALLRPHVEALGGELERIDRGDDLSSWFVRGVGPDAVELAVRRSKIAATVVVDAAQSMLAALPVLSEVESKLPRVAIPMHSKATYFDVPTASWVTTPGVAMPGAYRVEQSFKTVSIWVDSEGAQKRTCRIGSVQLVKHLAALHARSPLVGYFDERSMLLAPMGAELPGLYGRVASLCSGLQPQISRATRTVAYPNVPRDIADGINTLLSH